MDQNNTWTGSEYLQKLRDDTILGRKVCLYTLSAEIARIQLPEISKLFASVLPEPGMDHVNSFCAHTSSKISNIVKYLLRGQYTICVYDSESGEVSKYGSGQMNLWLYKEGFRYFLACYQTPDGEATLELQKSDSSCCIQWLSTTTV